MSALPYWKISLANYYDPRSGMSWPTPIHSNRQINKAGDTLARATSPNEDEINDAVKVVAHWRACHGYPINTLRTNLIHRVKTCASSAVVAQRLKRQSSIVGKLRRFPTMKLIQMQDIGGLRSVVKTIKEVRGLQADYEKGYAKHQLIRTDDYISDPKSDGYRSVHLIYRYQNEQTPAYDGMMIELQLRTKLQHAWATAVETISTAIGQPLKSNQGDQQWRDFFKLVSAAFSHFEDSPVVQTYNSVPKAEMYKQVVEAEKNLSALDKLSGLSRAINEITLGSMSAQAYFLIVLNFSMNTVYVQTFSERQLDDALEAYTKAEIRALNGERIDAVLATGGTIINLKKAYPNYFMDTEVFVSKVKEVIKATQS